jgi:hypothetical protein
VWLEVLVVVLPQHQLTGTNLDIYHRGSGQLINRDKSVVFFSNNTDDMNLVVENTLQVHNEALAEKYLGLPTAVGRSTKEAFEYMPTKIKALVGSWSGREASCAGRKILLKSKAQAVPTYPMSCFMLPISMCSKMRSTIANYWWGSSADNRRMHWLKWDSLTRPNAKGGMGFRDLPLFNKSLLGN